MGTWLDGGLLARLNSNVILAMLMLLNVLTLGALGFLLLETRASLSRSESITNVFHVSDQFMRLGESEAAAVNAMKQLGFKLRGPSTESGANVYEGWMEIPGGATYFGPSLLWKGKFHAGRCVYSHSWFGQGGAL